MRRPTPDTRSLRRTGTLLALFGLLILTAGVVKTAVLFSRGYYWPGVALQHVIMGFLALGFGGCGLSLLREARTLDYEAAHRPGNGPLRPPPGLRRRPRVAQSP